MCASERGKIISKIKHPFSQCETCALGKATRKAVSKGPAERSKVPLEKVHTDVCGPMPVPSFSGARYVLVLVDDATRHIWIRFLKRKSDAARAIIDWEKLISNQYGRTIKTLRSDNGGEFMSGELLEWLKLRGIVPESNCSFYEHACPRCSCCS